MFLNWESVALNWDSGMGGPGLTITICNKITVYEAKFMSKF